MDRTQGRMQDLVVAAMIALKHCFKRTFERRWAVCAKLDCLATPLSRHGA